MVYLFTSLSEGLYSILYNIAKPPPPYCPLGVSTVRAWSGLEQLPVGLEPRAGRRLAQCVYLPEA